jgi:octaprenyl-diphosphate synthase
LAASFPTPVICRAVSSATNTVCAGEILQTRARGDFEVTRERYLKMLAMKTGELFAISCDLGGFLSEATPSRREWLREYGLSLGTAYQLYDDCVDLLGSEAAAGKTLGADLANGKMTLPVLVLRDRASIGDKQQLREWIANWEPSYLPCVVEMMAKYDAFGECRASVPQHLDTARQALMMLPASSGRMGLDGLMDFLAEQTAALGVVY